MLRANAEVLGYSEWECTQSSTRDMRYLYFILEILCDNELNNYVLYEVVARYVSYEDTCSEIPIISQASGRRHHATT